MFLTCFVSSFVEVRVGSVFVLVISLMLRMMFSLLSIMVALICKLGPWLDPSSEDFDPNCCPIGSSFTDLMFFNWLSDVSYQNHG